jgi:hypothetical protein
MKAEGADGFGLLGFILDDGCLPVPLVEDLILELHVCRYGIEDRGRWGCEVVESEPRANPSILPQNPIPFCVLGRYRCGHLGVGRSVLLERHLAY